MFARRRLRVGLMVPELNVVGDAVGNDVLGMYEALSAGGYEVRIFVNGRAGHRSIPTSLYDEALAWLRDGDVLVYHYATADEAAMQVLKRVAALIILRYHNVT